jgi:N-acetylmuramoyl-L-alanine amidase
MTAWMVLFGLTAIKPLWSAEQTLSSSTPISTSTVVSTTAVAVPVQFFTPAFVTVVQPTEGAKLPALKETFVYGAVVAGSTLTLNGSTVPVHSKGGYLAMVPLKAGDILLNLEASAPGGQTAGLERRFSVAAEFKMSPESPVTIEADSIAPAEDMFLLPGDSVRVMFQGSPQGKAEFAIEGVARHIPMAETGNPPRGIYEGSYTIQADDHAKGARIEVSLKKRSLRRREARGRLTIDSGRIPRVGMITEESAASRTAAEGGYDFFLYKGMRLRLTGKIGNQWRVRFSALQSGWVKDSAIQELPKGTLVPQSVLSNMSTSFLGESTIVRIPLADVLPYRVEQNLEPPSLAVTLFGATNKTDSIRYDPIDPLVRLVRWRQTSPESCQVVVEPKFKTWWGYSVRYEGTTLVIELRKPWATRSLHDMVVAIDAGHGGADAGAIGPHGTLEKDANLQIAEVLKGVLEKSGAKPFLTRDKDIDVPLYERPRIAWRNKARIFVSVHCNSSGWSENPNWNNGSSVYWYQPQSQALAEAVHAGYRKHVAMLPDRGLFYSDFAVCRMTEMPAVLTEQAYIILPGQEAMLFDPKFQKNFANAIVNGLKSFVAKP